jgi:peptidoglycan/xylan/chitin deacetylase (PgdA/CDA1 family)
MVYVAGFFQKVANPAQPQVTQGSGELPAILEPDSIEGRQSGPGTPSSSTQGMSTSGGATPGGTNTGGTKTGGISPGQSEASYPDAYRSLQMPAGKKMVAITFDDGPIANTQSFCNILNSHGAKGTFFFVGSRIPDATQGNIAKTCGEFASHGYAHSTYFGASTPLATIQDDIVGANNVFKNVFGSIPKWYRSMGGSGYYAGDSSNQPIPNIINTAKANGQILVNWDVSAHDYGTVDGAGNPYYPTVADIQNRVLNNTHLHSGSIILMHQTYGPTLDALDGVITGLQAKGYQVTTVSDLVANSTLAEVAGAKTQAKPTLLEQFVSFMKNLIS